MGKKETVLENAICNALIGIAYELSKQGKNGTDGLLTFQVNEQWLQIDFNIHFKTAAHDVDMNNIRVEKMENKIQLTTGDLGLIEVALSETITVLKNRFKEETEFVHPAKKYQELYDNLTSWLEPLPVSVYFLSAVKDDSAYC